MSNLDLALLAATGFQLFLPLLILSGAAYTGHVSLNESFAWLGTAAMMIAGHSDCRGNSGLLQPGVDNLLDTLAMPSAVVAGTIALAATMTDLQPMLNWTTAVLAGGEVAGITQALTVMLRAKSTILTGGLGNSTVAMAELGGASLISLLALAAPLAALAVVILIFWLAFRFIRRLGWESATRFPPPRAVRRIAR